MKKNNTNSCTLLISGLYDVQKKILINYFPVKSINEREGLIHQLKFLKKNDILILDRGYYSKKILYTLIHKKIKGLLRLRSNYKFIEKLKKKNDSIEFMVYDSKLIKFRIFKCFIKKNVYYFCTTIFNKTISELKIMYWKRWKIECHFLKAKYNLQLAQLQSKTNQTVLVDLSIHNFIFIIASYIEYIIQKEINGDFKVNTSLCLHSVINDYLKIIFYENMNKIVKNKISSIASYLSKSLVICKYGRSYERTKKRPLIGWIKH